MKIRGLVSVAYPYRKFSVFALLLSESNCEGAVNRKISLRSGHLLFKKRLLIPV